MQDELFNIKISGTTLSVSPDKDKVIIGGKEGVSLWKLPPLHADAESIFQQQPHHQHSHSLSPHSSFGMIQSPKIQPKGGTAHANALCNQANLNYKSEHVTPRQSSANEILTKKMQPIMSLAWNHRISI